MATTCKTVCMLIYNYFPNPSGGAEKQCRLQSHELARTGNRCYILTAQSNKNTAKIENDQGCKIIRIWTVQPVINILIDYKNKLLKFDANSHEGNMRSNNPEVKKGTPKGLLSKIVQWLNTLAFMFGTTWFLFKKRKNIDIIHTHVASWNAGFAGWVGNLLDIPVVCKAAYLPPFHDFGNSIPFAGIWKKWRRKIPYIALLPEMAQNLCAQGVLEKNIHTIPNGVEIPVNPAPVAQNTSVLYVGNFSQGSGHKGFDILLKAWSIVCQEIVEAQLLIAGGGEKGSWESMARELRCGENVRFLGHVSDLGSEYDNAALFVLPSRGEGMSNALLEAQSHGLPAVVSDIPGNRNIVLDQKTGIIVPVDNYQQFAASINTLLRDKEIRVSMGAAARENISRRYSIKKIVEQVLDVYSLLCDEKYF